jgi:hypothetical protein
MDNIIEPTIDYNFSNLYLGPPSTLAGGSYFTKIMYNNNKLLYIQTPKCLTKQGFVKSGKKIFVDLMFDNNDTVFIQWIENLESKCQELLFSKGESWFQTKLEKDDIESAFTSALKIYKSGKYYLLRVNVKPNIKVYNESNNVVSLEDITGDKNIISILEIQGIKFTSRNFQIEIELKQSLIVSPDPFLEGFFIKKPITATSATTSTANDTSATSVTSNTTTNKQLVSEPEENTLDRTSNRTLEKTLEKEDIKSNEDTKINLDEFIKSSVNEICSNTNTSINTNMIEEIDPFDNDSYNMSNNTNTNIDSLTNNNENKHENENENDNIVLEIEDLDLDLDQSKEDPNLLKEVNFNSNSVNSLETITLKKPNQVYEEILKKAREKAKEAKKMAITAYLELKEIKKTYMIDDIDDSDSELEVYSDEDDDNEYNQNKY